MTPKTAARKLHKWFITTDYNWIVFWRMSRVKYPDLYESVLAESKRMGLTFPAYVHHAVFGTGQCPECGEFCAWLNMDQGFRVSCSQTCASKERNPKTAATMLDRYGVEHATQLPEFLEKRRQTWRDKYGADHPHQSEAYMSTNKNRIAKDLTSDTARANREATILDRYGVSEVLQHPAFYAKWLNSFRGIKRITIGGKTFKTMGYERYAIQMLVDQGVPVRSIRTSPVRMPEIYYKGSDDKQHRYYPDIRVGDRLLEIKSNWTLQDRHVLEKLMAMIEAQHNYEIWVIADDGKLLGVIKTVKQYHAYIRKLG